MVAGQQEVHAGSSITVDRLTFAYRRAGGHAVDGICLVAPEGVLGVAGVNGAGKSTFLAMLAGAVRPTSGHVEWRFDGTVVGRHEARRTISWIPQHVPLPKWFTLEEYLHYGCFVLAVPRQVRSRRIEQVLDRVGLQDLRRRRCGGLSGGEQRRLLLAWGMLGEPNALILDEPTAGLDVHQRLNLRSLLRSGLAPITVVSSHIVTDLLTVADRLLVLDGGRAVFDDSVARARELMSGGDDGADPEERFAALLDARTRAHG